MKERATFFDIDETLVRGAIAEGIGIAAYKNSNGLGKIYAIMKALQVKTESYFSETKALKTLAHSLGKVGLTKEDVEEYSHAYVKRKEKYGARKILEEASETSDVYLLTTGFDVGLESVVSHFNLEISGQISNELVYNTENKIISSNVMFDDRNIVKRVADLAHEYQEIRVFDDRTERYDNLNQINGFSDIEIFNNIDEFLKTN